MGEAVKKEWMWKIKFQGLDAIFVLASVSIEAINRALATGKYKEKHPVTQIERMWEVYYRND